ncbi:prepilin-type N-terminal cleavage/methylation domain-containing protein [Desulfovibrio aerotolerans]|uniref:Prepilin-type N-terminal cleavage/methylation domain-containing protein n=1 Tax=Solidesulfovibrio aerotolerans TaxID=295255 RepID=A0A7C9IN82_9BACT|nr:type II secretion system protein [Solidesulfovibrio aerotolerans]MYL84046.1 prepilin-type N-terminal cleavage/methylation domain-containing protein [Solidesulfovibrio aerotolerans]
MSLQSKINKNCRAFTLIEVICVLVLLGIVASIPLTMYTNSVTSHVKADANYSQAQNVQLAIIRITLELQNATNVTAVTNGVTYLYNNTETRNIQFKNADSSIVLTTSSPNANPGDHILVKNLNLASTSLSYDTVQKIFSVTITSYFSDGAQKTFTTQIHNPL